MPNVGSVVVVLGPFVDDLPAVPKRVTESFVKTPRPGIAELDSQTYFAVSAAGRDSFGGRDQRGPGASALRIGIKGVDFGQAAMALTDDLILRLGVKRCPADIAIALPCKKICCLARALKRETLAMIRSHMRWQVETE